MTQETPRHKIKITRPVRITCAECDERSAIIAALEQAEAELEHFKALSRHYEANLRLLTENERRR